MHINIRKNVRTSMHTYMHVVAHRSYRQCKHAYISTCTHTYIYTKHTGRSARNGNQWTRLRSKNTTIRPRNRRTRNSQLVVRNMCVFLSQCRWCNRDRNIGVKTRYAHIQCGSTSYSASKKPVFTVANIATSDLLRLLATYLGHWLEYGKLAEG